jgi:hypothetical protein
MADDTDTATGAGTGTGTGTGKGGSTTDDATHGTVNEAEATATEVLPPLPLAEVLSILIDVARAMEFCYAQTPPVHHRDLKPHNVLRNADGQWVVADFGISKEDRGLTSTFTKAAMASPAWASPEQLDGKHRGEASDVWSFGVLMWEVLTRQVPWAGKSHLEILTAIMIRGQRLPMPDVLKEPSESESTNLTEAMQAMGLVFKQRGLLAKMMQDCWRAESGERPSFAHILGALEGLVRPAAATQQAILTGAIIVEGQKAGEIQAKCMGVFGLYSGGSTVVAKTHMNSHARTRTHEFMSNALRMRAQGGHEVATIHDRGVWRACPRWGGHRHCPEGDWYCYFASDGRWWINTYEHMCTRKASGLICSVAAEPDALTPTQVKRGWSVYMGGWVGSCISAPNLRVRQVSAGGWCAECDAAQLTVCLCCSGRRMRRRRPRIWRWLTRAPPRRPS